MWKTKRTNRCLWSSLLTATIVACVSLVYLCIEYTDLLSMDRRIPEVETRIAEKLTEEKCNSVCNSKECIFQANLILRKMNERVDPCSDFNAFLCGGLEDRFGPDDRESVIFIAGKRMFQKLKDILENIQAEPGSASAKMKIMYDSCMSYGSELQALSTVQKFLNNHGILDWPKLPPDFTFTENLATVLGNLMADGEFEVLRFTIHSKNLTELQTDKKILLAFFRFSAISEFPNEAGVRILKYFDIESEEINQILADYEAVKSSISKLVYEDEICQENCSDVYLNCSTETDPEWVHICDTLKAFIAASDFKDEISDVFLVVRKDDRHTIKQIISLLKTFTDRSIANFLAMDFFWKNLGEFNFYFRFTKQKYLKRKLNQPFEMDKWKYCIGWLSEHMTVALQHEYVLNHLTQPAIEEITDICNGYTSDAADLFARQEWIPTVERSQAQIFLKSISNSLFRLKEILPNETFANEFFKPFDPITEIFFQNVLQFKRAMVRTFTLYLTNDDIEFLYGKKFQVQAHAGEDIIYSIVLHFGIFFPPLYSYGLESLINRVSFGAVFGHEMGHILFAFVSELAESNDEVHQSFQERIRCIEDQFSKFKFNILGENLNGTHYFSENLADNLYTMLVDRIIEKYTISEEKILPALPYSSKQLLYMSANQMWCSKIDLKGEMHFKTEDAHAPNLFRLLGTMQNSWGYSEAFHCPNGSYMNPTVKCSLLDNI